MALQQPRIVVEQSPWQTLFEQLPDTILAFHQLKLQAEEKEKDRNFQLETMYLKDLNANIIDLQKSAITSINNINKEGGNLSREITSLKPLASTPGGGIVLEDLIAHKENQIGSLLNQHEERSTYREMLMKGQQSALAIDENYDGIMDENELDIFEEKLGMGELTDPFIRGAKHYLNKPSVRAEQKKRRINYKTGILLKQLDEMYGDNNPPHLDAAIAQFNTGTTSEKVLDNIGKIFTESPKISEEDRLAAETAEANEDQFRALMDIGQDQMTRVSDSFKKRMPWTFTQDFKAGGLPAAASTVKENVEANLASWFREGSDLDSKFDFKDNPNKELRNKYAKYYTEASGDEIRKRAEAVKKTLSDPKVIALLSTDKLIEKNLAPVGDIGFGTEEDIQIEVFKTNLKMYNVVSGMVEGTSAGLGGLLKKLSDMEPDIDTTKSRIKTTPAIIDTTGTEITTPKKGKKTSAVKKRPVIKKEGVADDFFTNITPAARMYPSLRKSTNIDASKVKGAVEALQAIRSDPEMPTKITGEISNALDILEKDSTIAELVNAIENSTILQNYAKQTGTPIDSLRVISQWQSDGSPSDIGTWLMDNFTDIEPDFIR